MRASTRAARSGYSRPMRRRADESEKIALADTVIGEQSSGAGLISAPQVDDDEPDELIGARVDHFRIEEVLGRGGMGTVYVGHDISLDRQVALKMLRSDVALSGSQDTPSPALQRAREDYETRIMREARAQAKLQHPNVVAIHYIGRAGTSIGETEPPPGPDGAALRGRLYFAMELMEDGLDAILERGDRMDPEAARLAMIEVARGLRAAAQKGFIHRDIKPSNLLRGREGQVKIADFGLAKPVEGDVSITQEGSFVGSPLYMSPEQASGDPLDVRADMYSLGASFYHLVAGHPPFDGDTPLKVISRHLSKPVPKLKEAAPEVPAPLRRIIHKLLEKRPEDRYADYDELLHDLELAAPGAAPYAGFWIRAASVGIDTVIAGLLIGLLGWPGAVLHLLHVTLGHAWKGQTLAKYLLRIRVQRTDGRALGPARALARALVSLWMPMVLGAMILTTQGFEGLTTTIEQLRFGEMGRLQAVLMAMLVSNGVLSVMYLSGLGLAAFHRHKQSLHDLTVDSVVRYVMT